MGTKDTSPKETPSKDVSPKKKSSKKVSRQDALKQNPQKQASRNKRVKKKSKKSFPVYWVGLGVYTAVLLMFAGSFLSYTDRSLLQYENSQPATVMGNYLESFKQMAADGTLYGQMAAPEPASAFETAEMYREMYRTRLEGVDAYTFEKDASAYLAEEPAYYIYGDGEPVARVAFSASNQHTIFGILTIMDWEAETVEPILGTGAKDYTIQIPDGYSATVNGVELGAENRTGTVIENPEFVNVLDYVTMPVLVEYEVKGLLKTPEVRVFGADGSEKEAVPDAEGNIVVQGYEKSEMPKERYDDALMMAKAWENFVTRDLPGENHGLGTIRKYLIKDSYYWKLANAYAKSIDITFISGHVMDNPPYANTEITDYVSYGENCYSCHIRFDKNMILKNGNHSVDTIDSTFYFVKYDDSDDGKDNPHWAIADMIATTEKRG